MQKFLIWLDRLSALVGKFFAWSIVILTFVIVYEVVVRYAFSAPTTWAYDAAYMLYGTLFIMAGAYTLSRNGHVRGDFLYRKFSPRRQATMDLVLYFIFYFPAMIAFVYSGWNYFLQSYAANEHSLFSPAGPIIWPFKGLIPLSGVLMLLQGFAETARCVICLRTGAWPERLHDVEETERLILERAEAELKRGRA